MTPEPVEDFLAFRVGGDPYAVRLAQTAGLYADRKVVTISSAVPELLGLAGFRGSFSPVYDLGALLGYPLAEMGRWLLLVGQSQVMGLAFAEFDGHLRTAQRDIARQGETAPVRQHLHEIVRTGDVARPIVDLASVVEAIKRRVHSTCGREID